jgi:hypothetical protein
MAALRTCTDGAAGGEAEAAMGTAAAVGMSAAELGSPTNKGKQNQPIRSRSLSTVEIDLRVYRSMEEMLHQQYPNA